MQTLAKNASDVRLCATLITYYNWKRHIVCTAVRQPVGYQQVAESYLLTPLRDVTFMLIYGYFTQCDFFCKIDYKTSYLVIMRKTLVKF